MSRCPSSSRLSGSSSPPERARAWASVRRRSREWRDHAPGAGRRTLRAVGVEEILVVVGHEKERVREFVRERGLGVQLVENGDFGLGNGSSALVGARAAERRFLLAMVDHVVDPEALRRLLRSDAAFALAVDSRPHALRRRRGHQGAAAGTARRGRQA